MRKVISSVLVLLLCSSACYASSRFVAFPTVGVCTGDYVRYRARPDTNADIWGRLHTGEKVIVDGQKRVNGEVWYEILPKNAQDSAFVFGKYLTPYYDEATQKSPAGKLIIQVFQTYAPDQDNDYYDGDDSPEVKRTYNKQGWLVKVEAWKPGCTFGDIEIGDSTSKLTRILGDPDTKSASEWEYEAGDYAILAFRVKNGKITRMVYEE